jgi:hypothetical protein
MKPGDVHEWRMVQILPRTIASVKAPINSMDVIFTGFPCEAES